LQIFGATLTGQADDLSRALWIAVLTKFYSCFGRNASRTSLDPKRIYAANPDAMKAFWYYQNMRNKHIVHDENNYLYATTGIVLGPASDVQDILSIQFQFMTDNIESGQNMYNLVDTAKEYVAQEIISILNRAFKDANALTPQQRAALPSLQVTSPGPGDEVRSRKH
jgi:hypothetical protein